MGRLGGLSRGGRLLLALTVGGAIFGIATAVQADIPDSGVIHGCYQKVNGQLRVIDTSQGGTCRPSEKALSWNQTGPTGPTGATGPDRCDGADRPDRCDGADRPAGRDQRDRAAGLRRHRRLADPVERVHRDAYGGNG